MQSCRIFFHCAPRGHKGGTLFLNFFLPHQKSFFLHTFKCFGTIRATDSVAICNLPIGKGVVVGPGKKGYMATYLNLF